MNSKRKFGREQARANRELGEEEEVEGKGVESMMKVKKYVGRMNCSSCPVMIVLPARTNCLNDFQDHGCSMVAVSLTLLPVPVVALFTAVRLPSVMK